MEEPIFASYRKSPVREAIFSITFQEPVSLAQLQQFCDSAWVQERYGSPETEAEANEPASPLGYTLRTADRTGLLRLTTTQLHYHRLGTYPGWEVVSASFLDAWSQIHKTSPQAVSKEASIRYINRFKWNVPKEEDGGINLRDYMNLLPSIPEELPGVPGPFFLQLQTLDPITMLHSAITEVMELQHEPQSSINIVLDIRVNSGPSEPVDLPEFLLAGRTFKNKLFESCITPATRDSIA